VDKAPLDVTAPADTLAYAGTTAAPGAAGLVIGPHQVERELGRG
jgi:hypothetical protein